MFDFWDIVYVATVAFGVAAVIGLYLWTRERNRRGEIEVSRKRDRQYENWLRGHRERNEV